MTLQKLSQLFTKIGFSALQINLRHIVALFFLLSGIVAQAQEDGVKTVEPTKKIDSIQQNINELFIDESTIASDTVEVDSVSNDSVKEKRPVLMDKVRYKAKDYVKISRKEKKLYLYNEAELYYQDTELKAGIIVLDYVTNEVYAGRLKDSAGNYIQYPYFKQGNDVVEPDSIRFNYDTERAIIWNSKTEQNEFKVYGELTKKENDSVIYIKNAKFTTSDREVDPEYYFLARRIKLVPKKKIIAGFTNMYIADVPTPIALPFAFFPLNNERALSGFIIPTWGENNDRGYFVQNGGYYFAISDYVDLAVLGDYYTNGSWALRFESNYALRYKFRGNLSFRSENLLNGERGFPDFTETRNYNIRWSHSQDAKSNPSSRFSASVNLGSSQFYRQSVNQLNTPNFLNNTLSSSVSYSKTFSGYPSVNFSLTATHSQNTNTELINMTLPTLQASVERIYPFAKRDGIKKGIIKNINFQYNIRGENRIQTTDEEFFRSGMFDDAKVGMQHSIPVNTNFKLAKYLSVSMGGNYEENWAFNTIRRNNFNDVELGAQTIDTLSGFESYRTYNFNTSIGTTLYGQWNFEKEGEDRKIKAIRHVMRPTISYNINPAFEQYYEGYVIDEDGTIEEYSPFEQFIFGQPSRTFSSSIGLAVSNNIEAKVRSRDSTVTEPTKIKLLNNLNFSTNYNLAADSLAWSPLRLTGGTTILNNKMNINFGATLDPYALDNNNTRINTFNIDNGGSLFRLTSANVNVGYAFSSKNSKKKGDAKNTARDGGRTDDLFGEVQDFTDNRFFADEEEDPESEKEGTKLYRASIPWDIRFAYAITYSNSRRQSEISNNSLMFSGNVNLTPQWKVGFSSGYDFKGQGFTFTQLRFERDLESWRINFNWVPFSARASWYFFIGIKAGILRDLKYDKRSEPDIQL